MTTKTLSKGVFVTLVLLLMQFASYAQQKFKFGDVPQDDLTMTSYPSDTSAVAAVLYEDCDIWYDFKIDDLWMNTNYVVRIKILKPEGVDHANFSIPYVYTNSRRDDVSGISGYTYNINESTGKVERTKLTKEYIFEEKTSETWRRKKIAFPNVKAGSVIELKYELSTPNYMSLNDHVFQRAIPVRYSRYCVTIPEWFRFSKNTMGYERIGYNETMENMNLIITGGHRVSCSAKKMEFETSNLPALKDDSYVWNKQDFTSRINFELAGIEFPGLLYKNFNNKWEDIDKMLLDDDDFGKQFRYSNLLKDEMAALLKPEMSNNEKISAILKLVKDKVKWNDKNTLWSESVKNAVKTGSGSSSEMNALLICLLKDAGFEAYPVVMSLRSEGRIFVNHPSIKKLNYFIVGVTVDGKALYMDASSKYGDINVIPTDCMVEYARTIQEGKPSEWVDLQNIKKNTTVSNVMLSFNDEGVLTGKSQTFMSGVPRVRQCLELDKEKDLDEYKNKLESNLDVKISDFEVNGYKDAATTMKEAYVFENPNIILGDEHLYINPLLFPFIKDNPFKAETRKLPVEFQYGYDYTQTATLNIPKGYEVEEMPKSEKVSLNDGDIVYSYQIKNTGNLLQVAQTISVKRLIYPTTEYKHLRDFWAFIYNKNISQVVFKRVTQ